MTQLSELAHRRSAAVIAAGMPAALLLLSRWVAVLLPFALATGIAQADIAATVIAICFLAASALRRDFAWAREPWVIAAFVLYGFSCTRSAVAIDHWHSLGFAAVWIRFVLFAAALEHWVLTDDRWRNRLLYTLAAAVALLAADAILQYATGFDIVGRPRQGFRLTGPFGRPRVGITLAWLYLPAVMGLIARKRRLAGALLAAAALAAIVLSGDRMGLLFAVGALVAALLFNRGSGWLALATLGGGAVVVAALFLVAPQTYQRQVASNVALAENPLRNPYGVIWQRALAIAADHPAFGVGNHDYRLVCPDPRYGPEVFRDAAGRTWPRCSTHPHNIYLEWLVELGGLGLAGFLALVAVLALTLLRGFAAIRGDPLRLALILTALARLWPLQPSTSFFVAWSAVPLWLVVGWALSYRQTARPGEAGG